MASVQTRQQGVAKVVGALFASFAACVATVFVALVHALGEPASRPTAIAGGALLVAFIALAGLILHRLARPLDRLALDVGIIARENPSHGLGLGMRHWLGRLAEGIEAMRTRLATAEASSAQALAEARRQGVEQKRWLEAILLDLTEGIVVCNLQHQVLLYNQPAADLLGGTQSLGLGRSLFPCLTREPVLHSLERQMQRLESGWAGAATRFMCGAAESQRLLGARLSLVLDAKGTPNGYVLSLTEFGEDDAALAKRDDLLELATEGLRAPIANLRAAAETLAQNPHLTAAERAAFQDVLQGESMVLSNQIEVLARGYRELGGSRWMMAEIFSNDLIASLTRRMAGTSLQLTATGLPYWLYGDSLSLLVLIESLLRQLHSDTKVEAFDIALSRSDNRIYLDVLWPGIPIAEGQLEAWLNRPLISGVGPLTGRVVLRRHGTDAWSQAAGPGMARLRIPLASAQAGPLLERPLQPQRPEFYDFDLLRRPVPTGRFTERPLKQLAYVAFDLETTGLRPSEGDEVVSIAGVRIVNGRILTTETFERLVNPGRPIPEASIRFHGITDEMVRGKPPFAIVLPAFHRFAADAVLVAHNAAFDATFLYRAAEGTVSFDQPVVDTLLLSAYLYPNEADHSLDAIAARFGIVVVDRHSAIGDSLLAAAILLRLLDHCEERGITRLGQLIAATDMAGQLRASHHGLERHAEGSTS
jgi:DNA polymerase III subunit epsilon